MTQARREVNRIHGGIRLATVIPLVAVAIGLLSACGSQSTQPAATVGTPRITPVASVGSATAVASTVTVGSRPTNRPVGEGGATPPAGMREVTLADDRGTISLHVGERFLLNLGEGFDWTVTVADSAIVSPVVNITVVPGAQDIYEARAAGQTTLTAVGDPPCRKVTPPCMAPSRAFSVTIIVS